MKVFYIMDTMCGWCYGFSRTINRIYEVFKNDFDFILNPGGMWVGEDIKTVDKEFSIEILSYNEEISELSGAEFGAAFEKNILRNYGMVLDSMPGAKAVVLIQILKNEIKFEYLKKIQDAFFMNGKNPNDWNLYAEIGQGFGLSKEEFRERFNSEEILKKTIEGFVFSRKLGVTGFPSLAVEKDGRTFLVSQGLVSFDDLENILGEFI